MLTEQIKIKLHNALFEAGFTPFNSRRELWLYRDETSYSVALNHDEWNFSEDTSNDDGVFEYGDYDAENVEFLLDLIHNA